MSWEKIRFSDIYSENSKNGISVNKAQHNGTVKIVNMGELFANDFIGDIDMRRIKVEDTQLRRFSLTEGDLLFARRSLVAEGAGKVAMVESVTEPTVFESSIIRVRLDPRRALPRFYEYWFNSFEGHDAIARLITGTNVKGVRSSELRNITVPLPPLNVQQGIAGILFTYDKLIENNRKQIKLLEEAAQRLYKEWFVDLRFPGHETTPIHNGIPEGWTKGSLLDLADVVRGCSYSSDQIVAGNRTLINLGNLTPFGGFRFDYEKPFSGKARPDQTVCQGDVVMGLTEQATGLAGYAALLPCVPTDSVISADLVKLSPREGVPRLFVYALLQYGRLSALISPLANGTKIKHLRPESLPRAVVLLPATALMKRYAEVVKPMFDKIALAQQQIVAAREARDRLLPKLMSGEIEV